MIKDQGVVKVAYDSTLNEIRIMENYGEKLHLFINDKMLDLDKSVSIKFKEKTIYKGKLKRTILDIYQSLEMKGDGGLCFPVKVSIIKNQEIEHSF